MKEPFDKLVLQKKDAEGVDAAKRDFLIHAATALTGVAAVCALRPLLNTWSPDAKARASLAPLSVDISRLEPGQWVIVEWRAKPVWIMRRTPEMLEALKKSSDDLRDPDSLVAQQPDYARNVYRSIRPEYLVLLAVCTHLGCTPHYQAGAVSMKDSRRDGFFCPCHGSRFDLSGRVYKGVPAPINLEVPPYHFKNEHEIIIGED